MRYLSVGPGASLTRDVVCRTVFRTARGDSDILQRLHRLRTPCQHFHSHSVPHWNWWAAQGWAIILHHQHLLKPLIWA